MKVIRVSPSDYHRLSYMVLLESGEKLRVFSDMLQDFGIVAGRDLSPEELASLHISCECSNVEKRAAELYRSRPMSRKELIQALMDDGLRFEIAEATAVRLEMDGIVDDRKFADTLVKCYAGRGYGPGKIKSEFFARGLSEQVLSYALAEYPPSGELLDREISRLLTANKRDGQNVKRLTRELLRRGFDFGDITAALNRFFSSLALEK